MSTMAPESILLGMRFHPSEEEIMCFLLHKVIGSHPSLFPCDLDQLIRTADLYGKKEPWEIFGDSAEKELYFFTELKKVGNKKTSQRFLRNIGMGTWSNKGQKKMIYGRSKIIGYKRCYRYERRKNGDVGDDRYGIWLLKEYILPEKVVKSDLVKQEYKDYALCVLKKKKMAMTTKTKGAYTPQYVESGFPDAIMPPLVNAEHFGWELIDNDEMMPFDLEASAVGDMFGGWESLADDKFEGGERSTDDLMDFFDSDLPLFPCGF